MSKLPQVSATISEELNQQIIDLAKKESRSTSKMVGILLQQAVRERLRKRKNESKDNP